MKSLFFVALGASISFVAAQQVGTLTAETHPKITVSTCTKAGGCTTSTGEIVLDANWRWLHTTSGSTNCYTGNTFDATLCPDGKTCASNCAIDGADYSGTYGISTSGNALTLKFITKGQYGTNVGGRTYLMETATKYRMLYLLNKEFAFDVDMSALGCGLNGALYTVEMDSDGGMSRFSGNKAGAKYGTGYCDAQCPRDLKFINGEANVAGWGGSASDANSGAGNYGACCPEMDLWEANTYATAYTPHPCKEAGIYKCTGDACGIDGNCDKPGCDFNSYRMGDKAFLGIGKTVDTTKKITVVTQFVTKDGTDTGELVEIRRVYVQGGKVIPNSKATNVGATQYDSITTDFCTNSKIAFQDKDQFALRGGLKGMGDSLKRGHVLVMSVWDDHEANMLWLDSDYPRGCDPSFPGCSRGSCPTDSGKPTDVESKQPNAQVIYSNIKWGELGSTTTGVAAPPAWNGGVVTTIKTTTTTVKTTTTTPVITTTTSVPGTCVAGSQQCGGSAYKGATNCCSGFKCSVVNSWYSQCTPAPVTTTTTTTTAPPANCVASYGQCGGSLYKGSTSCCSGTCKFTNTYYSQCV